MPYKNKKGLLGERASKLSQAEITQNELIGKVLLNMEIKDKNTLNHEINNLKKIDLNGINIRDCSNIEYILAVDGSNSKHFVEIDLTKFSFITTGYLLLKNTVYQELVNKNIDPRIQANFNESGFGIHSAFFPQNSRFSYKKQNLFNSVRELIFDFFNSDVRTDYSAMKSLKYLMFKKWKKNKEKSRPFKCPFGCDNNIVFNYNSCHKNCEKCGKKIYITDYLGFHKIFNETTDFIPDKFITDYMLVHEHITLLYWIIKTYLHSKRYGEDLFTSILFIKDGPLSLDFKYSNLIKDINELLVEIKKKNFKLQLCGQEKTGNIVDYFDKYALDRKRDEEREKVPDQIIIINDSFVEKNISPSSMFFSKPNGRETTYGSKICYVNNGDRLIFSISTGGEYVSDPDENTFDSLLEVVSMIKKIRTYAFSGAIYPIALINNKVSISKEPSSSLLEKFLTDNIK